MKTKNLGILLLSLIVGFLLLCWLTSCYTRGKAQQQFGKSVSAFPEIGSSFCAITYPPRQVFTSDTVLSSDTLIFAGETFVDTIKVKDTVRITKTVQMPGKQVTHKLIIHDTITVVNTAELKNCDIERGKAIALLIDKTSEAARFKKLRNKWRLIAFGCFGVIGLGLFFKLRKSFANLKTTD